MEIRLYFMRKEHVSISENNESKTNKKQLPLPWCTSLPFSIINIWLYIFSIFENWAKEKMKNSPCYRSEEKDILACRVGLPSKNKVGSSIVTTYPVAGERQVVRADRGGNIWRSAWVLVRRIAQVVGSWRVLQGVCLHGRQLKGYRRFVLRGQR